MKREWKNNSPWLDVLNRTRPVTKLNRNFLTDVLIIGGGIAGVSTAYFCLTRTKKKVILLEASKIAHGATGHNAGQIANYFEKPFIEIFQKYGKELTVRGQQEISSAWDLLKNMHKKAKVKTEMEIFKGYAGLANREQIMRHLNEVHLQKLCKIQHETIHIREDSELLKEIPGFYKGTYEVMNKKTMLSLLETNDESYVALLESKKGAINSALFCEEIINYLLKKYKKRFNVFEETPVKRLVLKKDKGVAETKKYSISAKKTVLCTNGFENINIINQAGPEIDGKYHELVEGVIGYLCSYTKKDDYPSKALCYFPKDIPQITESPTLEPYFYLTRRKQGSEKMICAGGPDINLPNKAHYVDNKDYFHTAHKQIDDFLKTTHNRSPENIDYKYKWHGLMGYTKTGLRCIGPEPCNSHLLYNLGCNGVGILSSIYGGKKISDFIKGKKLPPSIFDPFDALCNL